MVTGKGGLVQVCNGIGLGEEKWFEENLRRVVGDGVGTYFFLQILGKEVFLSRSSLGVCLICM